MEELLFTYHLTDVSNRTTKRGNEANNKRHRKEHEIKWALSEYCQIQNINTKKI